MNEREEVIASERKTSQGQSATADDDDAVVASACELALN
jgi:hypothetical protein